MTGRGLTERDLLDFAVDIRLDGKDELNGEVEKDEDERKVEEELQVAVGRKMTISEKGSQRSGKRKQARRAIRRHSLLIG